MKLLTRTLAALAFVTLSAGTAAAQPKAPDLNGEWELNVAKSDFGPMAGAITKATITVEQSPTVFKFTQALVTVQGNQSATQEFTLDGKETTVTAPTGQTIVKSAKVDGDALVLAGKVQGTDQGQTARWTLSADGKVMTMDQQVSSPMGALVMKMVFDKK
jgi:hypothetical protein